MPFTVASHRSSLDSLRRRWGDGPILDLTSRGSEPWVRFSPFYPHGGIPVMRRTAIRMTCLARSHTPGW